MKREHVKVGQVVYDRWAGEKAEIVGPVNRAGFCKIRHIDEIYAMKDEPILYHIFWLDEEIPVAARERGE